MSVEQTCQLLVQCSGTDMHDSDGCEVLHNHLFSPRTVVADKKGKYSLQGIASMHLYSVKRVTASCFELYDGEWSLTLHSSFCRMQRCVRLIGQLMLSCNLPKPWQDLS